MYNQLFQIWFKVEQAKSIEILVGLIAKSD
jgi:hypothetical protein